MTAMRIAILLTCHNRRDKTHACLLSLSQTVSKYNIDIYLTDDGSTDGTSKMVRREFPYVRIIDGSGDLFWSRGMYTAWKEALKGEYDFYLWLNDDVVLYSCFLDEMMLSFEIVGKNTIVSGLIENKEKTEILYGGCDENKRKIVQSDKPLPITYMNGNVVLIPNSVVEAIGIIDPRYHHDLGDVDYGLRAIESGVKVVSTCKPVAYGYKNNYCRVRKWNSTLIGRYKKLYSPLGSNPSINFYFRKKHFGILNAISYWGFLHFINLLPDKVVFVLFGDKYKD